MERVRSDITLSASTGEGTGRRTAGDGSFPEAGSPRWCGPLQGGKGIPTGILPGSPLWGLSKCEPFSPLRIGHTNKPTSPYRFVNHLVSP